MFSFEVSSDGVQRAARHIDVEKRKNIYYLGRPGNNFQLNYFTLLPLSFRCEVSSEAPHFDTAVKAVQANVSGG